MRNPMWGCGFSFLYINNVIFWNYSGYTCNLYIRYAVGCGGVSCVTIFLVFVAFYASFFLNFCTSQTKLFNVLPFASRNMYFSALIFLHFLISGLLKFSFPPLSLRVTTDNSTLHFKPRHRTLWKCGTCERSDVNSTNWLQFQLWPGLEATYSNLSDLFHDFNKEDAYIKKN